MKNKQIRRNKCRFPVSLGDGAPAYFAVLIGIYALAQLANTPFTFALLIFTVCFPLLSIICLISTSFLLYVEVNCDEETVSRGQNSAYSLKLVNSGFFPMPKLSCDISLPYSCGSTGTAIVKKKVNLQPFSSLSLDSRLYLPRRGKYLIGTEFVYIYDLLHIIKIRKNAYGMKTVTVMPKEPVDNGDILLLNNSDSASLVCSDLSSYDHNDTREYRAGDSMKAIHWKLSSKGEELKTKKFASPSNVHLTLMCDNRSDMGNFLTSDTSRLEISDRTLEEALSVIYCACSENGSGELVLYGDNGKALAIPFEGLNGGDEIRRSLSVIGNGEAEKITDIANNDSLQTVYCLTYLDDNQSIDIFESADRVGSESFSVLVCSAEELVPEEKRDAYIASMEKFCGTLYNYGLSVMLIRRGDENEE